MMDLSDDENCKLYTRAALNIFNKRKLFTAKLEDFENVINLDVSLETENTSQDVCCESLMDIALKETNPMTNTEEISDKIQTRSSRRGRPRKTQQPATENRKRRRTRKSRTSKKRRSDCSNTNVLVSDSDPVIPVVPNQGLRQNDVIVLDDDTDFAHYSFSPIKFNDCTTNSSSTKTQPLNTDLSIVSLNDEVSEDEEDPVVISIEWDNGRLVSRKQFKLRKYQKFENIFEQLANIEGLPTSRILLRPMHDFININPADTPDSLNLKYYAGMTGSISATDINYALCKSDTVKSNSNEDSITVKLKLETQKTLSFSIMKHQKMNVLYKKCSEELKCDVKDIKLTFDGDFIDPKEQVSSLDIEDEDIFNVYFKKLN